MAYGLFLDDYRNPKEVLWITLPKVEYWVIVRNVKHFQQIICQMGMPAAISFDHDLKEAHYNGDYSDNSTGADAAKWLRAYCDENNYNIPEYTIHSLNQEASYRINKYLEI